MPLWMLTALSLPHLDPADDLATSARRIFPVVWLVVLVIAVFIWLMGWDRSDVTWWRRVTTCLRCRREFDDPVRAGDTCPTCGGVLVRRWLQ